MTSPIRIVDHKEMDLSAALFVVGFPGVGLVGSIGTNFLVSTLNLERVASVISADFPPMGVLKDARISSPVRIHAAPMVCGVEEECNQLAVVAAEVTPKAEMLHDLSEALLSWCLEKRVDDIVVLEGFARRGGSKEAHVYGAANSDATLERLKKLNVRPLAEGILTGLPGLLGYLGEAKGIDVTCLLAETVRDYPDARSAAKLLEVLDPFVPQIKIDTRPLLQKAESIEAHLKDYLEIHKENIQDIAERSRIMYG